MTPLEKKAILVITCLLIISYLVQWIRPHVIHTDIYDYSMEDSLFRMMAADTQQSNPRQPSMGIEISGPDPSVEQKRKKVDLNTAGIEELESLPRIGASTARLIIDYRVRHGGFRTIDELKKVPRIGTKTLELLRPLICIDADSL